MALTIDSRSLRSSSQKAFTKRLRLASAMFSETESFWTKPKRCRSSGTNINPRSILSRMVSGRIVRSEILDFAGRLRVQSHETFEEFGSARAHQAENRQNFAATKLED